MKSRSFLSRWQISFAILCLCFTLPKLSQGQSIQQVIEAMKTEKSLFNSIGRKNDTIYLLYGGYPDNWRDTFQTNGIVVFVCPRVHVEFPPLIHFSDTCIFWRKKAYIGPPEHSKNYKLILVRGFSPISWTTQDLYFRKRFGRYKLSHISRGNF